MQTLIFLYIVGVNIFQAAGNENSYQMYYRNLSIEKDAFDNLTAILASFVFDNSEVVVNITITTVCANANSGELCSCTQGYKWSDRVCKDNPTCCGSDPCVFTQNQQPQMCISNSTVYITGSITLPTNFTSCLAEHNTNAYIQCNDNVTKKMQTVYSTLKGFDVLKINSYRVGSIIADFEMSIASDVNSQDLLDKSVALAGQLEASLSLQTTGVVQIGMPDGPVPYNSTGTVKCTSQRDLQTSPLWQLESRGNVYVITNGTQAQVTSVPMESSVNLAQITELWAGQYNCSYVQQLNQSTITHRASAVIDVALLPNIYISTTPMFPLCKSDSDLLNVQVDCAITQNNDSYNVTWGKQNIDAAIIPGKSSAGQILYSATTVVNCQSGNVPQVTCTFTNRCNQTRNTSIDINFITSKEIYCPGDDVWPNTKNGFTAVLPCQNRAGQRQRKCSSNMWEPEVASCVNQDLYNVLQNAIIVDIGLGGVDSNAASVLSQLQNATNNTGNINTFPNVKTSVQVLESLSQKPIQINNMSSVNDLLESSSNLLENSLQNSWTQNNNNNNSINNTLAVAYLNSVEHLIHVANVTSENKKTNIQVDTCNNSNCKNTVFNVNVSLAGSSNTTVKTAGYQQLQNYMPYDDDYKPNSIIVSTTTNVKLESLKITIDFPLLEPRPQNVEILCVSWDNNNSRWSQEGCTWVSSQNAGQCVCTHLSSFAILMSRKPLELSGATEITYAGLSVSIMSLVIVLVIELIVWSSVVKTNTLYLRHTTHVNISICLLIADCCFLASSTVQISDLWCETFVVLKHFCYLSMFFWMLCLSVTLLHQAVFLFHNVSKKNYLRFSLILGYVCPFLIVFITFLTNQGGKEGSYFNRDTCWLVYTGFFKGSIFTFLIPVGIIIFINVFSMVVVIMKLLDHPKTTGKSHEKDKTSAKTVMRTVVLLTPIFGITWAFGFGVMILDLTSGLVAFIVNYAFIVTNSFQGFFILATTCLGDKMIREALLNRLKKTATVSVTHTDSTTKLESSWKK